MKPALRASLQTIDESVNCSYRKLNVAKFVAMCYIPSFHFLSFTLHFDNALLRVILSKERTMTNCVRLKVALSI